MTKEQVEKNLIIKCYTGSMIYGTYEPDKSDKDYQGIFIPNKEFTYGLNNIEQYKEQSPSDLTYYAIRFYFRLALRGNPGILESLWLEPNHYIYVHPIGKRLIENRDIFTSKAIYKTYGGYASGQLHRLQHIGDAGYKRKLEIETYGYSPKNAMHLIRLLEQGTEFLTTGQLQVMRSDSQFLLSIKRGEKSLSYIEEKAEHLKRLMDEAFVRSGLPNQPDYIKAEKLLIEIQEEFWNHPGVPTGWDYKGE